MDNSRMPMETKHAGAARKGKAVEHLVAASCILASDGELNVSTALVDDEGVDLVFHRRGRSRTLAVQVKSRFRESSHLGERGQFIHDIRDVTFRPRDDFWLLFVAVDGVEPDFGPVWFVPSRVFAERVSANPSGRRRFAASAKDKSQDQWREFRLEKSELPTRILGVLGEI